MHEFSFVQQRFPSLPNFHLFLPGSLPLTGLPRIAELPADQLTLVFILSFSIDINSVCVCVSCKLLVFHKTARFVVMLKMIKLTLFNVV